MSFFETVTRVLQTYYSGIVLNIYFFKERYFTYYNNKNNFVIIIAE